MDFLANEMRKPKNKNKKRMTITELEIKYSFVN